MPGVVDEDVERTDLRLDVVDELLEPVGRGEVELEAGRPPARGRARARRRPRPPSRRPATKRSTIARPMPLAPPVTRPVLPLQHVAAPLARQGVCWNSGMKITDVEPIVLRLDRVDASRADGTQDAFLVRVHTDEGVVGIGEADTSPYVARTIVEMPASHSIARGIRELIVGEDPLQIDRLWQLMFHGSDHYGRGGAALHVISRDRHGALGHLRGKVAGRPVADLLGGRRGRRGAGVRERGDARDGGRGAADRRASGRRRLHGAQARLGAARPQPRHATWS